MKNITYADKIRNSFLNSANYYIKDKKNFFPEVEDENFVHEFLNNYYNLVDQDIKQFIKAIISTDYFIILNYDAKRNEAYTNDVNTEFNNYKQFISTHDFNILLSSEAVAYNVFDAVKTIQNASFYKRIAILKALTDDDIKFILTINPFFNEELKQYNIETDAHFFYSEIDIQESTNIPNLEVYNCLASLLIDLFMIDEDLVNGIVSDIIDVLNINGPYIDTFIDMIYDNDISGISSILCQYYTFKKDMFETNVPKK